MGLCDCTSVFRVELDAYKPFVGRDFDDFCQAGFRVDAGGDHAGFFECFTVLAIEFIAMAVAFPDVFLSVCLVGF